jgi:hypothetical protein
VKGRHVTNRRCFLQGNGCTEFGITISISSQGASTSLRSLIAQRLLAALDAEGDPRTGKVKEVSVHQYGV